MASVLSTVLSRLNTFLDSELEQIVCFDSDITMWRRSCASPAISLGGKNSNPTKSDGNNFLTLVNHYMDIAVKEPDNGSEHRHCQSTLSPCPSSLWNRELAPALWEGLSLFAILSA